MTFIVDNTQIEGILNYGQDAPTLTSTATSLLGTLTLTSSSTSIQVLTGTATGYSVVLPNATTLTNGWKYKIFNQSSQNLTIKDTSGGTLFTLGQSSVTQIMLQSNSTANGTWIYYQTYVNIAQGIVNYTVVASAAFSTTSATDVLITGFTVTPVAGTYAIWYNAESYLTTTPKPHYWSIYKAGVQISDSERRQDTAHSNQTMTDATMTITTVNGSQAIDVRVRRGDTGTLTIYDRSIVLIRLGN